MHIHCVRQAGQPAGKTRLYGIVCTKVVLIQGLQPAAVIVRVGHNVHIQHFISPVMST